MTKAEEAYFATLNLLGSDVQPPEIQKLLDREHALADPNFAAYLKRVATLEAVKRQRFVTSLNHDCGIFETDGERSLYTLAATSWNNLQVMTKMVEELLRENMVEHDKLQALLSEREGHRTT